MIDFVQGPEVNILMYSGSIFPRNSQQILYFGGHVPDGLVARIRRFHRRGPGSIPGQGIKELWFFVCSRLYELLTKNLTAHVRSACLER